MVERTVPLVQERIYAPPRAVEVEVDGRWVGGLQRSWHQWDDDRGWVAEVEVTVTCYWGALTRSLTVPAARVRPASSSAMPGELRQPGDLSRSAPAPARRPPRPVPARR